MGGRRRRIKRIFQGGRGPARADWPLFRWQEIQKKKGGEQEEERTSPYPTCFSPNMGCSCSSSSAHLATWGVERWTARLEPTVLQGTHNLYLFVTFAYVHILHYKNKILSSLPQTLFSPSKRIDRRLLTRRHTCSLDSEAVFGVFFDPVAVDRTLSLRPDGLATVTP